MKKSTILILGADGLLGQSIHSYFKKEDISVIGTSRKSKHLAKLEIDSFEDDLKKIINSNNKVNFVINCIGITNNKTDIKNLILVNSLFPQNLSSYLNKIGTRLIHISSDSVYSTNDLKANENSKLAPDSMYGASKILGEPNNQNTLSIRTSILGISNNRTNGLLDSIRKSEKKNIDGYTNQNWSGCTTLQLAIFCKYLINNWGDLNFESRIINFAPIQSVSKYEILKSAQVLGIIKATVLPKIATRTIKRKLSSLYFDSINYSEYTSNISLALKEIKEYKYE